MWPMNESPQTDRNARTQPTDQSMELVPIDWSVVTDGESSLSLALALALALALILHVLVVLLLVAPMSMDSLGVGVGVGGGKGGERGRMIVFGARGRPPSKCKASICSREKKSYRLVHHSMEVSECEACIVLVLVF
ncbi:hypothetical protein MPTK1_6g14790 [Marchantia polymorpha subsp. ruderalis]|uniref:Transmembrane protein n=2 Tax=Marchantia polymorpha TaxID=3197 RepID=A0AAF6BS41_MARPO|nr:hypothetical protein MARPO_0047s0134 [Marchantia polymorpha]BBN14825.1 hypothetical protein Mp_6g14790 [Marchantia polymorpha subsp. ruderalis]|eukprot:PTQ39170.1 hypothetical protein MARPO_0047s0134 [Marchantia polymorpha]